MSEVIAVMNQKGGCGKTTTVVNTATSLAVMGKSVLVVDMDPQANATTSFGIDKTKIENTIYDAIIGDISIKKQQFLRLLKICLLSQVIYPSVALAWSFPEEKITILS